MSRLTFAHGALCCDVVWTTDEPRSYIHSIGITKTHAIVCAGPLHWDVAKLLSGGDAADAWT